MKTINFYFCYFYEDLLSHCYQGLLSWKQITQLDTAVAFYGCFQRDQERKNKQTWHFRNFYVCWYTERQKKRHSQHGKAFISFVNGIFLKNGMARRMLDFNRCSMPTQWHIGLPSQLFWSCFVYSWKLETRRCID